MLPWGAAEENATLYRKDGHDTIYVQWSRRGAPTYIMFEPGIWCGPRYPGKGKELLEKLAATDA